MSRFLKYAMLAVLAGVLLAGGVTSVSARTAPAPLPAQATTPRTAASFVPEFIGDFPPEAIAAWDKVNASLLRHVTPAVDVTVRIEWKFIDGGFIGMGGSTGSRMDFPNAAYAGTWYPVSLANQIAGTRLADGPDISIDMNSDVKWDFSGNPPQALKNGVNDYVTTLIHEIIHGMGFFGTASWVDGVGSLGDSDGVVEQDHKLADFVNLRAARGSGTGPYLVAPAGVPTFNRTTNATTGLSVWDQFIVDGDGNLLINEAVYPNPSTELGDALTSNNLFWNGPGGVVANGGKPVKIYAPKEWVGPSSYCHLDDGTYDGGPDSILTSAGEKMPNIELGPRTVGILGDMGWKTH